MSTKTATAIAHPNIAFIKYWGNRDDSLRLPLNGSISMNLESLITKTTVVFDTGLKADLLTLNGAKITGPGLIRVKTFLDHFRNLYKLTERARVNSTNDFPTGAGIASSASAFAALAGACFSALKIPIDEVSVSRLARFGSGSACRSVPAGFVEWLPGESDQDSYAISIADQNHWALVDCIAVISRGHKNTSSTEGHALAASSPLQNARVVDAPKRLEICRSAILSKDFNALAGIAELDSNIMHAIMMTSIPPIYYWEPTSLYVIKAVTLWRKKGIPVFFTLDAGANVHVITLEDHKDLIVGKLRAIPGVNQVLVSGVGGGVRNLETI